MVFLRCVYQMGIYKKGGCSFWFPQHQAQEVAHHRYFDISKSVKWCVILLFKNPQQMSMPHTTYIHILWKKSQSPVNRW